MKRFRQPCRNGCGRSRTKARSVEFLQTNFNELEFGRGKKYCNNSSFGDVRKLFDPTATYRWKSSGDKSVIHFSERLLSKEMKELGYETQGQLKAGSDLWRSYRRRKIKTSLVNPLKNILRKVFL